MKLQTESSGNRESRAFKNYLSVWFSNMKTNTKQD